MGIVDRFAARLRFVWNDSDVELLRREYPEHGSNIPALLEKFPAKIINYKAMQLKIRRLQDKHWELEEEELLKQKYAEHGTNIPELLTKYSRSAIRQKATSLGLKYQGEYRTHKPHRIWTNEEIKLIAENFPSSGTNIPELLKTRTEHAIQQKAFELGLQYEDLNPWTEEEEQLLLELYPTQGHNIPTLLERHSEHAIGVKARKLGLTRLKPENQ